MKNSTKTYFLALTLMTSISITAAIAESRQESIAIKPNAVISNEPLTKPSEEALGKIEKKEIKKKKSDEKKDVKKVDQKDLKKDETKKDEVKKDDSKKDDVKKDDKKEEIKKEDPKKDDKKDDVKKENTSSTTKLEEINKACGCEGKDTTEVKKDVKTETSQSKPCNCSASSLEILNDALADVAEKSITAVVNISSKQVIQPKEKGEMPRFAPGTPFDDLFKEFFEHNDKPRPVQSLGSGFIVKLDKEKNEVMIVTNYHVISDAKKITIILHDKTEIEGTLHAFDDRTDLAVIKAKIPANKNNISALEWGDSETVRIGHKVLAIGNPFGLGSTVTSGIVSSKGRDIAIASKKSPNQYVDDFIQHDASINMGNSGGVLIDIKGRVIGINTAIFSTSGGSIGIGFAIPSAIAKATIDQLLKYGHAKRGWLGVKVHPVTKEMAESLGISSESGGIVMEITPDSPAAKAGIKEKDIIIEFNGKKLDDKNRLTRVVGETEIGKAVTAKVVRNGKEITIDSISIGEFPTTKPQPATDPENPQKIEGEKKIEKLGLTIAPISKVAQFEEKAKTIKGVIISKVDEGSNADERGLLKGDIITQINQKEINSPDELMKNVEEFVGAGRKSVLLSVVRVGLPEQFVVIPLESEQQKPEEQKSKKTKG